MRKKKIIIQTNNPLLKTGLAENGRALLKYLLEECDHKYDVVYYCTQTSVNDPVLNTLPCKAYGSLPADQQTINQLNSNPGLARDVSYGSYYIDEIIKKEKPDAILFSDDIWSFSLDNYANKKWHSKLSPIYHITVDSMPILDQAFQQAEKTPYYFTWAQFAAKEMQRFGPKFKHVKSIYGAVKTEDFAPITKQQKLEWRKKFGISENTIIIGKLGRNQLRKEYGNLLLAFSEFKKENPSADVKLHFHTSFSEKGQGWDIERLMAYYGIKKQDVLCTYICRDCGEWTIEPYQGEDIKCNICGAEKSKITCNIQHGVPNDEMKFIYGVWDAGMNLHTSGGQELNCVNTLLCGLPLACTNYASGEDFCEQEFVTTINFEKRFEAGTSFLKSSNSIISIKNFISKIYKMKPEKRKEIGQRGYEWASETFTIDTIGKQWEQLFDSLPFVDWENFQWDNVNKNPNFVLPENYKEISEDHFLTILYKEILDMDEPLTGAGRANWKEQIKRGATRESIYEYFKNVALEENNKNKPQDLWNIIDINRTNKRALFVLKESIGDCVIATSLFESFHERYPNYDLYVSTEPKFFEVFEGNPYIHKLLPYNPIFEQEMAMIGAGQDKGNQYFNVFFHPAIQSQRLLNYLSAK